MLKLLKRTSNVLEPTDEIVDKIYNDLQGTVEREVIITLISSQTYIAFHDGVKKKLKVRLPGLGIFKVNTKAKRARSVFKFVLEQCDGDREATKKVIQNLRDNNVLETIQV